MRAGGLALMIVALSTWTATSASASPPPIPSLTAGAIDASRDALEADGVASHDIPLPTVTQVGDKANCGPTAATMLLAPYRGATTEAELTALRDEIGQWSWDAYPLRRVSVPGYPAGMTTPAMLQAVLARFGEPAAFAPVEHPWLPGEAYAMLALRKLLAEGRPVIVLTQSSTLWGIRTAGLHWVVVRGIQGGKVVFNDPADGERTAIPFAQFWEAWRLNDLYRSLPLVKSFAALAPDRPVPREASARDVAREGEAIATQ